MTAASHTWSSFKAYIDEQVATPSGQLYRGQSNEAWGLVSTYHRLVAPGPPALYWNVLNTVHDYVSTLTDRVWDLKDNVQLASFLGYLQHNGFPTPLLDWTRSPYAAAYFAFAGIDDASPTSDNVSIFAFKAPEWSRHWRPVYDVQDASAHVSVLYSESRGNRKQLVQQGTYTYSTVPDQEAHINAHAAAYLKNHSVDPSYLRKLTISVHEKPLAMRDLAMMGISALNFFPTVEGACQHLRDILFPAERIGATPSERTESLIAALKNVNQETESQEDPETLEEQGTSTTTDVSTDIELDA